MDNMLTGVAIPAMPSLPPRVVALVSAVGIGTVVQGRQIIPHLQEGELTEQDRKLIHATLGSLLKIIHHDQPVKIADQIVAAPDARLTMLTSLMAGSAGPEISDFQASARFDLYELATDDLPPWALAGAIRRWARGDCPAEIEKNPLYKYAPASGTLRKLAELELKPYRQTIDQCNRLLACVSTDDAMAGKPRLVAESKSPAAKALRRMP